MVKTWFYVYIFVWSFLMLLLSSKGEFVQSRPFVASEYHENGVFFPIKSNENAYINLINNLDLNNLATIEIGDRQLLDIHLNFSNFNRAISILKLAQTKEFIIPLSQALNETIDNIVLISTGKKQLTYQLTIPKY